MEKSYRLILKNLSPSINDDNILELFKKFGDVEKVDLKEKQDVWDSNKINRFAFVTIKTSDRNLHTCKYKTYLEISLLLKHLNYLISSILFASLAKLKK